MLCNSNIAQVSSYTFTKSIGTYTPITTGTVLGNLHYTDLIFTTPGNISGTSLGGLFPGYPIGFDFNYDGTIYDRFVLCANGWIKLGRSADSIRICYPAIPNPIQTDVYYHNDCTYDNYISAFSSTLTDGFLPVIRYQVAGTAPNKVLTIQWLKFYCVPGQLFGANTYSINFQIKLYQGSNIVEFVYGTFATLGNTTSVITPVEIGLKGLTKHNTLMCKTDSSWDATYSIDSIYSTMPLAATNFPPAGLSFKFTPGPHCQGTPNAGTATSSLHFVCPTDIDSLKLIGNDIGVGINYQWESSLDTINWTPLVGKTKRFFATRLTATTFFRCIVSCDSGSSDTSAFVKVTMKDNYLCSTCLGPNISDCYFEINKGYYDLKIPGTTFHLLDQGMGCNIGNMGSYRSTYDPIDSYTANLLPGIPYYLDFTPNIKAYHLSMWIDYNHNSIFDASEYIPIADTVYPFVQKNVSFSIPGTAYSGYAQVRFLYTQNPMASLNAGTACSLSSSWIAKDFIFFIGSQLPCTSPPFPGIAVSSKNNICNTDHPVISLIGSSGGIGISYQWQLSYNNLTWSNLNETNPSFVTSRLADTVYYHCVVTCNGLSQTSTSVGVFGKLNNLCYCASGLGGANCSSNDFITNVKILGTSLDNGDTLCTINSAGSNISIFDTTSFTTTTLHKGSTYTLSVTCNQSNRSVSAWIDFNRTGIYTMLEYYQVSSYTTANIPNTVSFTVPSTASLGLTGLRVRSNNASGSNMNSDVCSHFIYGETEEYYVTIDVANGITETSKSIELQISPNPAIDVLNLTFFIPEQGNAIIELMSSSGQNVYAEVYKNLSGTVFKTIDVSKLAKGLYFLQIKHSNGIETKKIIID